MEIMQTPMMIMMDGWIQTKPFVAQTPETVLYHQRIMIAT